MDNNYIQINEYLGILVYYYYIYFTDSTALSLLQHYIHFLTVDSSKYFKRQDLREQGFIYRHLLKNTYLSYGPKTHYDTHLFIVL